MMRMVIKWISLWPSVALMARDRFLECYVHDKNSHWHLAYCYDRLVTSGGK